MIASLHVTDVGARRAPGVLLKTPKPAAVAGLRHADVGLTAPLSRRVRPSPNVGRVGLVAFWDDDDALDRFLAEHPVAAKLAGGWHVRLEPLRAFGSWPGLGEGIPAARVVDHDGPAAVLTLGRLRPPRRRASSGPAPRPKGRSSTRPG